MLSEPERSKKRVLTSASSCPGHSAWRAGGFDALTGALVPLESLWLWWEEVGSLHPSLPGFSQKQHPAFLLLLPCVFLPTEPLCFVPDSLSSLLQLLPGALGVMGAPVSFPQLENQQEKGFGISPGAAFPQERPWER